MEEGPGARERLWRQIADAPSGVVRALLDAGRLLLEPADRRPAGPLADLAAELGPSGCFEFLLNRHLATRPSRRPPVPPGTAALMAELAGPAASVLDPACGAGDLLAAAARVPRAGAPAELHGREADPDLARLAALRLALGPGGPAHVRPGDALHESPSQHTPCADVVLCRPPSHARARGHDTAPHDPPWEHGLPVRAEPELAWVQHALSRLRPGGTAVVLMPEAAASRPSGRRIRKALLRRGALRAVLALPAGAVPAEPGPGHLWVLRRPEAAVRRAPRLLFLDVGAGSAAGDRAGHDRAGRRRDALEAWRRFDACGDVPDVPGAARSVAVIDLLDDDTDLTPARHLRTAADARDGAPHDRERPAGRRTPAPTDRPYTTIGELAAAGALRVLSDSRSQPKATRTDDVVVRLGREAAAHVVTEATAGGGPGRHTLLLRPEPTALDPHFLAGFLRGTLTGRQDVCRLRLPRLPLAEQRRHGAHFHRLAAFEDALRHANALGGRLARGLHDGRTDDPLPPG